MSEDLMRRMVAIVNKDLEEKSKGEYIDEDNRFKCEDLNEKICVIDKNREFNNEEEINTLILHNMSEICFVDNDYSCEHCGHGGIRIVIFRLETYYLMILYGMSCLTYDSEQMYEGEIYYASTFDNLIEYCLDDNKRYLWTKSEEYKEYCYYKKVKELLEQSELHTFVGIIERYLSPFII